MRALELRGKTFGRLTVLDRAGSRNGASLWRCLCECGAMPMVIGECLNAGKTKSCGCLRADTMRETASTHGLTGIPEHIVWKTMHIRCFNPKHVSYPYYGGRGITIDPAWRGEGGFDAFLSDMGPRPTPHHTIDRIDNDGNYEPGNCRWATWSEQRLNRRTPHTHGAST